MELARGQVTDRPWGMTLGALGARRCTGQLTLQAEGKQYCLAFDQGAVIGATSPLASDAAPRIALIHHLIAPAHVADLTRRIAAAPKRDEIELIAEVARLTIDQAAKLRRWVLEQRAARTFSVDAGDFVIDSSVRVPVQGGLSLDVRSVIYQGARVNLSELRLGNELRQLGVQFVLDPEAEDQLGHFGFTDSERPILHALRAGTTVAELEARHRAIDPRTIQAVIYTLVSCAVATGITPPSPRDVSEAAAANDFAVSRRPPSSTPSDVYSRTRTGRDVFVTRPPTPTPTAARTTTAAAPGASRPPGASRAPAAAPDETGVPRAGGAARSRPGSGERTRPGSGERTPPAPRTGPAPKPDAPATPRTQTPVTPVAARAPTPTPPRTPTPNHTPAAGRTPTPASVGRTPTPASVGRAPTPASVGRAPTPASVGAPRTKSSNIPINARTRTTARVLTAVSPPADAEASPPATDPVAAAKEAFKRGLSRLRVENLEDAILDLTRAVDLQPSEVDYAATLAWARFCHTTDKPSLAQTTREALTRAIRKSQSPEMARFYLGRVERMLGRDKEALRHFQEVLEAQPKHADAAAEIRAIEARMATAAAKESGVFGRKR